MPEQLFDTNVWIASVFPSHGAHQRAQQALQLATPARRAIFCRSTQQSFLRLASTPAILKAYGAEGMTNHDSLLLLRALLDLPQVGQCKEQDGVEALWQRLASRNTASPKVWMDAYLAAFAIGGGLRLVTLDHDFKSYQSLGLKLTLLKA